MTARKNIKGHTRPHLVTQGHDAKSNGDTNGHSSEKQQQDHMRPHKAIQGQIRPHKAT